MIEIKRIETESGDIYKVLYADTDSVITKDEHYHKMIDNTLASSEYKDLYFELFLLKYWLRSEYHIGKIDLKEWWNYRRYLFKKYLERILSE